MRIFIYSALIVLALAVSAQAGPVAQLKLKNDMVFDVHEFPKFGKYYIYISGTFNGRGSTVISLTRMDDLMAWKRLQFKDAHTFRITTRSKQQLTFTRSHIYMGCQENRLCLRAYNPETGSVEFMEFDWNNVKEILMADPPKED